MVAEKIAEWKESLRDNENTLQVLNAQLALLQQRKRNASEWRSSMRTCLESMERTNELIGEVASSVSTLKDQVKKACAFAVQMRDAIRLLFCMVKASSEQLDAYYARVVALVNKINTLGNQGTDVSQSKVLACLQELITKLELVFAHQEDLLKMSITALKRAEIISHNLCQRTDADTPPHNPSMTQESDWALETVVTQFGYLFASDTVPNGVEAFPNLPQGLDGDTAPCGAALKGDEALTTPLDISFDNQSLEDAYNDAQTDFTEACGALDAKRSIIEQLQTQNRSLKDAIAAAEKALNCK